MTASRHGAPTTAAAIGFGALLRELRVEHRPYFSQSYLAARADMDHSIISRYEGGSRQPSRDSVLALADALGLSDVARDALLMSAGFQSIAEPDPLVEALAEMLGDLTLPEYVRIVVRNAVDCALVLANATREREAA